MKKVISLILALTMLVSSMAITVNATDDQTITLDGDRVETSVISCAGTLTIEGKGSLTCPGINAKNVVFKSGYVQINGSSDNAVLNVSGTITLDGAVIRVINQGNGYAIDGNIVANAGVMTGETINGNYAINLNKLFTNNNEMKNYSSDNVFEQCNGAGEKNSKQIIFSKNASIYDASTGIDDDIIDSSYYVLNNSAIFYPAQKMFSNGTIFYRAKLADKKPPVNIKSNIFGDGTIVGISPFSDGLVLKSMDFVSNSDLCLVGVSNTNVKTIYPESNIPSSTPTDLPEETPTDKDFILLGEIVNQTKSSVTIRYKIVKNDGVCEIMLKPMFNGQNIEVFVDKNALGNSWSDVLSKEGYAYELYCNNASIMTNTNLAIITYTNIKADDTFGLEYSYTPDDSGSFTTQTNEITIQTLTHQAVFHFMYNESEINTVTHTDVEIETTLTDLSELDNNIHWFKQSKWYSDDDFTSPINYMPNKDIDVYCNYELNVKIGDIDGSGTVSADDLTLLRKYRISDTDEFVFINDEDDAFNTYDENKKYIFLCCANVNSSADNKIDGADVLVLSWAICSGKEGSQDYSYMLSSDESSVIKRQ